MSDKGDMNRRALLAGVVGLAGGAAGGYFFGKGSAPEPTPITTPSDTREIRRTESRTGRFLTLEIRGAYGLLFKKDGEKQTLRVLSLKQTNGCDFFPHPLRLIVHKSEVTILKPEESYKPTDHVDENRWSWLLEGPTVFTEGIPNDGIGEKPATAWDSLKDPYAPKDPGVHTLWDDQVWLPERKKARSDIEDPALTTGSLLLTDGALRVLTPESVPGAYGKWVFDFGNGTTKSKALTDGIALDIGLTGNIGLKTKGGDILLKPNDARLSMLVQYEIRRTPMSISENDKLKHFDMLHVLTEDKDCKKAIVPTYKKRTDVEIPDPRQGTPGDLCPPLPLYI